MKQSKFVELVSDNHANYLVFIPSGEPLVKWICSPRASLSQNIRLAEAILECYDSYLKSVLKG